MGAYAAKPVRGTYISEREKPVSICLDMPSASQAEIDEVKYLVCTNDIIVFSDPNCGYCYHAEMMLVREGVNYLSVHASQRQRQKLTTLTGNSTVPSVWVKGKYIGGCNDGPYSWMGLSKTLASGLFKEFMKDQQQQQS